MSIAGVVVALAFEARCLGAASRRADGLLTLVDGTPDTTLISISGMGRERAARAARKLVKAGASALLSWGTAGALDPSLGRGAVLLASQVMSHDPKAARAACFSTAPLWRMRVRDRLAPHCQVIEGRLLTCATPVASVRAKAELFRRTGAIAVDMESAAVADVAKAHRLPFMAIRAIVDTATDPLPDALVQVLHAELRGEWRMSRLALPMLQSPTQWSQLARLAWRYRSAGRSLSSCARVALAAAPASLWKTDA